MLTSIQLTTSSKINAVAFLSVHILPYICTFFTLANILALFSWTQHKSSNQCDYCSSVFYLQQSSEGLQILRKLCTEHCLFIPIRKQVCKESYNLSVMMHIYKKKKNPCISRSVFSKTELCNLNQSNYQLQILKVIDWFYVSHITWFKELSV